MDMPRINREHKKYSTLS